ncbi:MAG: SHOCT domain-containing protein [Halanaeroarchaeum sp.]
MTRFTRLATRTRRIGTTTLATVGGLALAVGPASAQMGGGMGGGYAGSPMGGGFLFGGILWPLLLLGGLFALVYWAFGGEARRSRGTDPAVETLRERYARGEISEEEFETRRRRLER